MTLLAGDLGGTKTLLALCQNDGTLLYSQRLSSQAFASLDEMVAAFLASPEVQGWDRPSKAAFGVAGPVTEIPTSGSAAEPSHQRAHITNLHYHIDTQTLAQRAGGCRYGRGCGCAMTFTPSRWRLRKQQPPEPIQRSLI